ncbi:hypothetical protein PHLGIDRAFT_30145 [Phlebiopsis gigantea 11061_1 CR5-6]|uniref:histidine kinase n=1 Tax=Phlebiopsis gigantea (strain 11061_1 CR5-6) TaxID=745531 RepID=A0A0C3PL23_PHLG1|nr:hypothetical protein PHLGIDRAFT_30145 [Phlebiopsis gigantea 11061_1 CR5-6]
MPPYHSTLTSSIYDDSGTKAPAEKLAAVGPDALLPAPAVQFSPARRKQQLQHIRVKESAARGLRVQWDRLRRKFGSGTAPSASSDELDTESVGEPSVVYGGYRPEVRKLEAADEVDEVIVDREWGEDVHTSSVHSGQGGSGPPGQGVTPIMTYLRWRVWETILRLFVQRFLDEKSEEQYRKEQWFLRKHLALWSAGFFILNWVLGIIFIPKPITIADKIFYYAIAPAFTFPLFLMVLYDLPRDHNWIYQTLLTISTWMWGCYQILTMYLCAYYGGHRAVISCGTKDFLATFYYANGPQTIALFGLGLHRFPALVGTLTFMSLAFGMIVPDRTTWVRNVINFVCYQGFLLYLHYMRENVRVPLNTALLAVQNMAATGLGATTQDIEFRALEGSLSMMSKVLNDVLDFNRMDSGRFESVSKPYPFHQVMHSLLVPLKMATDARGLMLVTDLDVAIDNLARRALYQAQGCSEAEIAHKMLTSSGEDGIVVGDENRLRQIITNLASNACKFTPAGGQLTVTTRLILPHRNGTSRQDSDTLTATEMSKEAKEIISVTPLVDEPTDIKEHHRLSSKHLARHNSVHSKPPPTELIVVRIEIADTGCGIKPMDMIHCKLFSAFNQTEMGRQQGGKGTGLGLALVRQIVKLSGGRLGVQSRVGQGSTFWVELPLGVGEKATPWLTAPQFTPQTAGGTEVRPEEFIHDHLNVIEPKRRLGPSIRNKLHRTTSAMHSIMDQGGLVEISTDSHHSEGRVLTRTIGDPSTGTDPTPSAPLTTPDSSPPQPPVTDQQLSDVTIRPTYVQLPSRQRFSLEQLGESYVEPAGSMGETPLGTPSGSSAHSSLPGWGVGMRVLVVDDDPLTRKLMARMLTRLGCRVSTAENGEIALDLILGTLQWPTPSSEDTGAGGLSVEAMSTGSGDEYKYAVVFLDNQMPVLSGLEMIARLRDMGRKDFVVGVTGNALLTDQQEYLEAGVDRVLTKPVFEKSLKAMLTQAEERRKRGTPIHEQLDPAPP